MLKRIALCAVLVAFAGTIFAADLATQSVGLTIEKKSPNYNIDLMLLKVILSVSSSNQNVKLYSSEKADLEYTGIKELNGEVLMKSVKKSGYYQIELYEQQKPNPVLFDDTLRISLRQFGDTVDDVALQIVNSIAKRFPQKPAGQLTKINLVKVKLSEYESQDGFWSLSVLPCFSQMDANVSLKKISTTSFGKKFQARGGSIYAEAIYRYQQWNFGFGGSYSMGGQNIDGFHSSFNDCYVHAFAGYGIFGSLIILGLQPDFYYATFRTDYTNYDNYVSNTLVAPDITVRHLQLSLYLQINISKDYYITFISGPPLPGDIFNGMTLDFTKNGKYTNYTNPVVSGNYVSGIPYIRLTLNFRLFSSWWLRFSYDTISPNVSRYNNGQSISIPVTSDGQYEVEGISVNKTRICLGIQYDF